ncbi:MAG: hypothetical protein H6713_20980 [Myxococcales bacterium]|nr:hypothetical protein [Myxococcales bacterium]MCB9752436.1 hypothetical protein [Myxococcales bacterium]
MKKMAFLLLGFSLVSFGCAEQPGKKKEEKPAAKKDTKNVKDAKKADDEAKPDADAEE